MIWRISSLSPEHRCFAEVLRISQQVFAGALLQSCCVRFFSMAVTLAAAYLEKVAFYNGANNNHARMTSVCSSNVKNDVTFDADMSLRLSHGAGFCQDFYSRIIALTALTSPVRLRNLIIVAVPIIGCLMFRREDCVIFLISEICFSHLPFLYNVSPLFHLHLNHPRR